MKRLTRTRQLTADEATRLADLRQRVAAERPQLLARHADRERALRQLPELLGQLKASREARGLSLADLTRLTGMDRSALSRLETGERANPTLTTLVRYAEAVGKRLVFSLADDSRARVRGKSGTGRPVRQRTAAEVN